MRKLLLAFAILICFSGWLKAQVVFERLGAGLSGAGVISSGELNDLYEPGTGFAGFVKTDFYYGELGITVDYAQYEGLSSNLPDFKSFGLTLNWDFELLKINRFYLSAGALTGMWVMRFEELEGTEWATDRMESESYLGFTGGAGYNLTDDLELNVIYMYRKIYTRNQINLQQISAGIAYYFDTPDFLKEFLK